MRVQSLALRCSIATALAAGWAAGTSVHLRATSANTAAAGRLASTDSIRGEACQFVAHRPDDSEEVLSADGPQVLFHSGAVAVVEKKPMRYLVSFADGGACNEQAEMLCISNSTGASCDDVSCVPDGNGDVLLSYLRSMVGGALVKRPPPSRSAVIGLGSGAMAFWLGNTFRDGTVDAVDLSADVIAAAKCFGVRASDRLNIVQDEGRHFLVNAQAFAYDAIFLDAFDAAGSLPPCLATAEFFELIAQKLSPDQGVLAMNLGARDEPGPVLAALRKVFMHVVVGHAPHLTNHLVLASQTEIAVPSSEAGAAELLAPGSIAANLTRWARQADYSAAKPGQEVAHKDATSGCVAN